MKTFEGGMIWAAFVAMPRTQGIGAIGPMPCTLKS